jgi:tetratricopeptide (TPR) repeat protein
MNQAHSFSMEHHRRRLAVGRGGLRVLQSKIDVVQKSNHSQLITPVKESNNHEAKNTLTLDLVHNNTAAIITAEISPFLASVVTAAHVEVETQQTVQNQKRHQRQQIRQSQKHHQSQQNQQQKHQASTTGTRQRSTSSLFMNTAKKRRLVRYLYNEAKVHIQQHRNSDAKKILRRIVHQLDPYDAHSYLALAKLLSREETTTTMQQTQQTYNNATPTTSTTTTTTTARHLFRRGTHNCPTSIHLWHGWAMHERYIGNITGAIALLDKAFSIDPTNGYVCHAYGLLEMELLRFHSAATTAANATTNATFNNNNNNNDIEYNQRIKRVEQLWSIGLQHEPSAALACSLGQLYEKTNRPELAKHIYITTLPRLQLEHERVEVCLAVSSLMENVYNNIQEASVLLMKAFDDGHGGVRAVSDSRVYVALARLGLSTGLVEDTVVIQRLRDICTIKSSIISPVMDGRLFNAWAKLESRSNNNLVEARRVLQLGLTTYPKDHTLLQAAGRIEEKLGNIAGAREYYKSSLAIELSAPTLIAVGMLEMRSPEVGAGGGADDLVVVMGNEDKRGEGRVRPNINAVRDLFNKAISIDPKHGPAYNAYGNLERQQGNLDKAKQLYEDGIRADCTDAPSVYHGLAKLHLSLGEVEAARCVLQEGLSNYDCASNSNSRRNDNVAFLAHTLSLIELNCNNNPTGAKAVLDQGLKHRHNSPQLLLAMALCELRLGNEKLARTMFERSLSANPKHAQAWQAYGVMEMQCGNFKSAKTLFECGIKNSPSHGALWQSYGILESWKGNIAEARILFAAGINKCPQHISLYQAWACLELRSGDIITAKRLIGEALTRNKRYGSGWLVAAKIEEKMNNIGLVGLILRRGIECDPSNTELYRALAEHEISRGKYGSVSISPHLYVLYLLF